ncbi:unnamed protein product [Orchesella dallaii]|uniref:Uncharacterized protein n=1 Tax=Orchesella dallaii TaxID=48710 RepID=A0ABP1RQA6_9HEXA
MDLYDFPKSITELRNRPDFDLVYPFDVIHSLMNIERAQNLSEIFSHTYFYIFSKAFVIPSRSVGITLVADTLLNISEAKNIRVTTYAHTVYDETKSRHGIMFSASFHNYMKQDVNLQKFVSICLHDCPATMKLFGKQKNRFIRKPFKQESLLKLSKYWFQVEPNFATFRFSRFLSCVVQSGLHDFANNYYEKFKRMELLDRIAELRKTKFGGRNGLFSLTFLSSNINENQVTPGDLSTFVGVIIVSAVILSFAMVVFMLEVWVPVDCFENLKPSLRRKFANLRCCTRFLESLRYCCERMFEDHW